MLEDAQETFTLVLNNKRPCGTHTKLSSYEPKKSRDGSYTIQQIEVICSYPHILTCLPGIVYPWRNQMSITI